MATADPGSGGAHGQNVRVDPIIAALFAEMRRRKLTLRSVAYAAGMHHRTLEEWRAGRCPTLHSAALALAVVGLRLAVLPIEDAPP